MDLARRHFLISGAAFAAGFSGLQRLMEAEGGSAALGRAAGLVRSGAGYGPLAPERNGVLELPRGFRAWIIARTGRVMDDGFLVPGMPDGMAAFPGPDGRTVLVCNHELEPHQRAIGPYGRHNQLLGRVDAGKVYDRGRGVGPALGGTTTIVFNTATGLVEKHFLSLAGTMRNCAGGPTPWGTWLTCEEDVSRASRGGDEAGLEVDHGYVFEVPAAPEIGLADPKPIRGMGRFYHEAVAIDPRTGIVYLTEDRSDGLLYRYVPAVQGEMLAGGRLQALAVRGRPSLDTRNWQQEGAVGVGSSLEVEWIDVDGIESPRDDLRARGFAAGAARFARGEGMWYGHDSIYFCCTNGGQAKRGQVWRLTPSREAGEGSEGGLGGASAGVADRIELFIEPNDAAIMNMPDNITVAPWGDLIVCEDGTGRNRLLGITPRGEVYELARCVTGRSELAGATFSPDGTTLLVNLQQEGLTLAVSGPWHGS